MNELREAAPLEIALRRAIEALEGHTGTHNISCVCWDCETVLALRAALVASRAPVVDLSHPGDAYAGDTGILTNVSALAAPRALEGPPDVRRLTAALQRILACAKMAGAPGRGDYRDIEMDASDALALGGVSRALPEPTERTAIGRAVDLSVDLQRIWERDQQGKP